MVASRFTTLSVGVVALVGGEYGLVAAAIATIHTKAASFTIPFIVDALCSVVWCWGNNGDPLAI